MLIFTELCTIWSNVLFLSVKNKTSCQFSNSKERFIILALIINKIKASIQFLLPLIMLEHGLTLHTADDTFVQNETYVFE